MLRYLRRGDIVRIRDERWTVRRHHQHSGVGIVEVCGCGRSNRGVRTRFLLPFEPCERLPCQMTTQVVTRRRWRHLAKHVLACAVPEHDSLRTLTTARIDLLPFQLEPALAVVRGAASRILIADEVGLGKTVQAGLIVAETLERHGDARVLIICPAALRDQWSDELSVRFGLEPARFDSATAARSGSQVPPGLNPWAAQRLIVTSVDYIKRPEVLRALEGLVWDVVVIDEAHGLAGRSERLAAALALGERARLLVLLTATPHSGDDEAFLRLCGIGDIRRQFPLAVFRRSRHDVALASSRRTLWLHVMSTPAERAMHQALAAYARVVARQRLDSTAAARLAMIVLLRRGCSSAAALARSIERRLLLLSVAEGPFQAILPLDSGTAEDAEPAHELAAAGLAQPEDERRMLQRILTLALDARGQESKVRAIRRLLLKTREQAIVFTEYRDTLDTLSAALAEFGCVVLHGALPTAERRDVLQQFVSGAARVLLATDAASEGLNLHERCRLVVNLELPWTPLRLEQRVGRVDRIGQLKRVHQILLVAAGTAEQSIVGAHVRQRRSRADRTLAAMRPDCFDERDIAARVLDGTNATIDTDVAAALPEGIFVANVAGRSLEEVERATAARRLVSGATAGASAFRPFASAASGVVRRGCWVFKVALSAGDDELLCETLLGTWYGLSALRFTTARDLVRHLDISQRELLAGIRQRRPPLFARLVAAERAAATAAMGRERAIVEELEDRRARLVAASVQRALFDRRMERDTAARREVLNEALEQCRDRLVRLTLRLSADTVAIEPAFAVILR
jgi:superfamily II DNA or RNA helicase